MRNSMPMPTAVCSVFLLVAPALLVAPRARLARADAPEIDLKKQEAKDRKARYEKWMREYSEGTAIHLKHVDRDHEDVAELVSKPIFRYSEDNINADDATLWVWTHDSRPIAFQKAEVNNINGERKWTICFGSTYEGLFDVQWPGGRQFSSRAPGVKFRPIPDAEPPAADTKRRSRQLKSLKDRFTGHLSGFAPNSGVDYDLKPLPTPIFEYADPEKEKEWMSFVVRPLPKR